MTKEKLLECLMHPYTDNAHFKALIKEYEGLVIKDRNRELEKKLMIPLAVSLPDKVHADVMKIIRGEK